MDPLPAEGDASAGAGAAVDRHVHGFAGQEEATAAFKAVYRRSAEQERQHSGLSEKFTNY